MSQRGKTQYGPDTSDPRIPARSQIGPLTVATEVPFDLRRNPNHYVALSTSQSLVTCFAALHS